jgi:hypothetical protein
MEIDVELVEKLSIEGYRIRPDGPEDEYDSENDEDYDTDEQYIEREQLSRIYDRFLEDCIMLITDLKKLNFPG